YDLQKLQTILLWTNGRAGLWALHNISVVGADRGLLSARGRKYVALQGHYHRRYAAAATQHHISDDAGDRNGNDRRAAVFGRVVLRPRCAAARGWTDGERSRLRPVVRRRDAVDVAGSAGERNFFEQRRPVFTARADCIAHGGDRGPTRSLHG